MLEFGRAFAGIRMVDALGLGLLATLAPLVVIGPTGAHVEEHAACQGWPTTPVERHEMRCAGQVHSGQA